MANNILTAVLSIVGYGNSDLKDYASTYHIRINAVGEQLEFYVRDAIAGSFQLEKEEKERKHSAVFSWLGNQNNPPDVIINSGDAFEIKKIEGQKSSLALNSSPPKDKLLASDPRVLSACKNCEDREWKEKDFFYAVGQINKSKLKYLFFAQGLCYAASHEVYNKIHDPIKKDVDSVLDSLNLEKGETIELGKVKNVDPLGITELRIRGMWSIKNPLRVFGDYCPIENSDKFHLFALMTKDKYHSFPKEDIKKLEAESSVSVEDIQIKDPNNPAKRIAAKLVTYKEQ